MRLSVCVLSVGLSISFSAKAADFSVKGISLGMTLDQIKEKIGGSYKFMLAVKYSNTPAQEYLALSQNDGFMIYINSGKMEFLEYLANYPTGEKPLFDDFKAALLDKYGPVSSDIGNLQWQYDADGKNISPKDAKSNCIFGPGRSGTLSLPLHLPNFAYQISQPVTTWVTGCNKGLTAYIYPNPQNLKLLDRYVVSIWDQTSSSDAALEQKKATDEATKKATEDAKKIKPSL